MITPAEISRLPKVRPLIVPEYDFEGQVRSGLRTPLLAAYTFNSIQTFGQDGRPKDAQNDNND